MFVRDLYILALLEMQAMDESDELSYFSLAGKLTLHTYTRAKKAHLQVYSGGSS